MHHPTDKVAHTTAFVTPVVEHWLEREIALWVHHEELIRKSSPCFGGSGFPLSLYEWSFTIILTPHNRKNVSRASLNINICLLRLWVFVCDYCWWWCCCFILIFWLILKPLLLSICVHYKRWSRFGHGHLWNFRKFAYARFTLIKLMLNSLG